MNNKMDIQDIVERIADYLIEDADYIICLLEDNDKDSLASEILEELITE